MTCTRSQHASLDVKIILKSLIMELKTRRKGDVASALTKRGGGGTIRRPSSLAVYSSIATYESQVTQGCN